MNTASIGVLWGGPSNEYDVSIKTGHSIRTNLPEEEFSVRDIYIDKQGVWHERGMPVRPEKILPTIDAVLIGLHGEYGEDGEVQKVLERHNVPYAGSDSFGSFLAFHKLLSKHKAEEAGLLVPRYRLVESPNDVSSAVYEIIRTFPQPVVVKPVKGGSSVGVSIVSGYGPLEVAMRNLFADGAEGVLVEERIRGREATVGIAERLRGEALYALPPVEIIPPVGDFFSYEAKYSGKSQEVCPANFSHVVKNDLMNAARTAHKALGLRHYSRSDFIVSPRGIYYLETNTLPGMTEKSLFPKALEAVGISLSHFFTHLAHLALKIK